MFGEAEGMRFELTIRITPPLKSICLQQFNGIR